MLSYIIFGQGLAGSAVAHCLRLRGIDNFIVVDPGFESSSSFAAAGVFNPITGLRWSKTWMADQIFPFLDSFYREIELFSGSHFYYPSNIVQILESVEQQNFVMGKSALNDFKEFVNFTSNFDSKLPNAFGLVEIKQSGFLDVRSYLKLTRTWLARNNRLFETYMESKPLEWKESGWSWGEINAKNIILCTGIKQSKMMPELAAALIPLKGEMIEIEIDQEMQTNHVLKKKVFAVPVSESRYWIGSTYDRNFKNMEPSIEALKFLMDGCAEIWTSKTTLINQWTGQRPTTPDRRPLVGALPNKPNAFILNGLGTKGVSLSPFFASALLDLVEKNSNLTHEVSPERFFTMK